MVRTKPPLTEKHRRQLEYKARRRARKRALRNDVIDFRKALNEKRLKDAEALKSGHVPHRPYTPMGVGNGRKSLLTPERKKAICEDIVAGCFLHVAARANGISLPTLELWMREGRQVERRLAEAQDPWAAFQSLSDRDSSLYSLLKDVEFAQGMARKSAETRVMAADPRFWLRCGPGRDRGPREPGWTDTVQHSGPDGGPIPLTIEDLVKKASVAQITSADDDDATGTV